MSRKLPSSRPCVSFALTALLISAVGSAQQPRTSVVGDFPGAEAGRSLASGMDLNGDGRNDFLVGARGNAGVAAHAGRVFVYSGLGSSLATLTGGAAGDEFGVSCAIVPDLDGDGRPDILVGARGVQQGGAPSGGRVYIYRGETPLHLWDYTLLASIDGPPGSEFGTSVASVGDVDGDNVADFAVGAPSVVPGLAGRVFVYSGATRALLHVLTMNEAGDGFGYSVVRVADADGDGFADLMIGAITADVPPTMDCGLVYTFRMITAGHSADWSLLYTFMGEGIGDRFGLSAADVGDLNGDGRPELLVGASRYDDPNAGPDDNRGKAYLFDGATGGVIATWTGEEPRDWMGIGVAGAGDVDGDGRRELLLGACQTEKGGRGKIYLVETQSFSVVTRTRGEYGIGIPHQGDAFGFTVLGTGDLDGDGAGEYLVGAYGYDGLAGANTGKVTLYSSAIRYYGREWPAPNSLTLSTIGWPTLGTAFTLVTRNGPPNSVGLIGFSPLRSSFPLVGGRFLLDPNFITVFYQYTDANGEGRTTFDIPSSISYLGEWGNFQTAVYDPAQPQGVDLSFGMTLVAVEP